MLRACIDAGTSGSGVFSVAGIAFGYDRAAKANKEWERLMDGRTFHMTDLNARRGDFAGISNEEVAKIMQGIVRILRHYASIMIAVSCDADLIGEAFPEEANRNRISEEMRNAFRTPYGMMCHLCMFGLGTYAERNGSSARSISYVLESGDEGQNGLIRFARYLENDEPHSEQLLRSYSYARLTTMPKDHMEGIFHSADFLAWEWARHVQRHKEDKPMRKSLQALTGRDQAVDLWLGNTMSDQQTFLFRHYNERNMNRFVRVARRTIEAKTSREVRSALDLWDAERS